MADPIHMRFGGVNLTSGDAEGGGEMPPETPFRLLISGNLSGRRPLAKPLDQRKPIEIDRDNFDEVLAKIAPTVSLKNPAGGGDIVLSFRELDDFEPDRLFQRLAIFDDLRTLQSQLSKPSTFPQAAAKIQAWANILESSTAPAPKSELSAADILAQVLEERPEPVSTNLPASSDWQQFLSSIVKPQLVEKTDPRLADFEAVVEEAIGASMRSILHHPEFQALEAAWRSVFLLVKRLPTDENLKLFVLDASLAEWQADVASEDLMGSVFVREVIQKAETKPWAAFVSLETFGRSVADLETLASMNLLAAHAQTPVLAAASPQLFGCPSLASDPDPRDWQPDSSIAGAYQMIRVLPHARFLGLVVPRFLLRLPYGKDATRTEAFSFEENPRHDDYLWGSGAVAAALLLAEGFVASGWGLNPDDVRQISGLPVHVYDDDGERTMKPCAEVHLRESALEAITEQGLMVLASVADRDAIRLVRFQSAAEGMQSLVGRW